MSKYRIGFLVGSLRKDSINMKMARALMSMAPGVMTAEIVNIADLPLYNEDLEASMPAEWKKFREKLSGLDGVVFVTPEYNRSVPGVLKNAIDVGSRPYGRSVWDGKPGAVVSVSRGALGAFGANHHLRQSLVCLNVPTMQQPEAYIGGGSDLFNNNGEFKDDATKEFMTRFITAFLEWVKTNLSVSIAA